MATMRSAYGAARLIADAMGRTFMEYKEYKVGYVGKGKVKRRVFRDGTVQLRRAHHPSKRLYYVVLADNKAPYGYQNPFHPRNFSARELQSLSNILNTIRVYKKAGMKKRKANSTMGFEAWKKSGM